MAKKHKKGDHQKTKFKVGSLRPKGLNITDTKFKAKKIKIPVQLKPTTLEPRSRRYQSVEDLLKSAGHNSVIVRHSSLINLLQVLPSHKELIEIHVYRLLEIAVSGLWDATNSIRQEALNLLCLLLETLPAKIASCSSVLIPHVCCAMTSIHHAVRVDSLRVVDVCLDAIPSAITSSEKILKNFLTQITYEKAQIMSSYKSQTNLSYEKPSERIRSHNWRTQVLCTLSKYLKAIIRNLSTKDEECFSPVFFCPVKIPGISLPKPDFPDIENYIFSLMSTLFNIWLDAAPSPILGSGTGELVSAEAAEIMEEVLQVIRLICQWIKVTDAKHKNSKLIEWFNGQFRKQICSRLMVWFPYSQSVATGKRKSIGDAEISCFPINLAICSTFAMLPQQRAQTKLYQNVSDYLLYAIDHCDSSGVALVSIVTDILKALVTTSTLELFEPHLNGLLKCYKASDLGQKERRAFLDFMIELILDINNKEFLENAQMMPPLMQSLLQDLLKMHQNKFADQHLLGVINQLNAIAFQPFIDTTQENSYILIEFLQSEQEDVQKTAVELIYRVPHIPPEFFHELAKAIFNPAVKMKNITHLLALLSSALSKPLHIPSFTGKDFVNFLMCLTAGMFKDETGAYLNLYQDTFAKYGSTIPFHLSEYFITPSKALQRHFDISKAAIQVLMYFPDKKQISQCIHTFLVQFTTHCACFPVHTGLGLLLLEVKAYELGYTPDDIDCLLCITEVTIALFMYQIAWEKGKEPDEISAGSILGALYTVIKKLNSMRHLCEIFAARVRDVNNIEHARCVGNLMLIAVRKELLPPADLNELRSVLQELHAQFGNEIMKEPWWNYIKQEVKLPPYCAKR